MIELGLAVVIIVVGYIFGSANEKRHFEELKEREASLLNILPTRSNPGPKVTSGEFFLVTGSVVVGTDAFKNFVGGITSFFGGRMVAQETLLDRARREAVCRLREDAIKRGAKEVVDLHIETSYLDQMGVEVSAYATAIK